MTVRIEWTTTDTLVAHEPTLDNVRWHLPELVAAYNDPHNAALLGHTSELTADDVLEHYANLARGGGRPFLLLCDGLVGDADLRGIADRTAEFAFLIASPAQQGKGYGTRFAIMIHAYAFTRLELERVYASVIPANAASLRVFEKLGYAVDDSPRARACADDGDVTLSIDRTTYLDRHAAAVAQIRIAVG